MTVYTHEEFMAMLEKKKKPIKTQETKKVKKGEKKE